MDSCFTLTFAVEVLNENNEFNDNNNTDWMELGLCNQGLKIQYILYPGYTYDLDVLIWPNAGKIWCGNKYGWVRAWQFLNKYWMVFTIRHKLPVKVEEFRHHEVIITPTIGTASFNSAAKNDRNFVIHMPPLEFGEFRYFAKILEKQNDNIIPSIIEIIWSKVLKFIPASYLDGPFDNPQPVSDVRHQDTILAYIKESILSSNYNLNNNIEDNRELSNLKDKGKKAPTETGSTYKLKLSGDAILAGSGRINRFVEFGNYSTSQRRILAVMSSSNLPAQDDSPIMFVIINSVTGVPVDELHKAGFLRIYTRWKVGTVEHDSEPKVLKTDTAIQFNDHHVIPIENSILHEVFYVLMDNCFEIQLRGIKEDTKLVNHPKFFNDEFGTMPVVSFNVDKQEQDVLIACTRIDVQELSKGPNKLISREFSLYPKQASIIDMKGDCTNYINAVRPLKSTSGFQPYIVLQAHMMIEVAIGLLGCEIHISRNCFSRLYCFVKQRQAARNILESVAEINRKILIKARTENLITGFSLDTGDTILIFVEGEKNKDIIKLWEIVESFYPVAKTIFSSTDTHLGRIYPDMINSYRPFDVLIMHVSLSTLLACPSVYVRPALPIPAKMAMLKFGHIIAGKLYKIPSRHEMPTTTELRSFKMELCVPLR